MSVAKVSSDISSTFCQLFVTSKIKRRHDLIVFYTVSFGSTQPMEQNIDKELFLYHPFALDQWWKHPFYTNPIDMLARSTIRLVSSLCIGCFHLIFHIFFQIILWYKINFGKF